MHRMVSALSIFFHFIILSELIRDDKNKTNEKENWKIKAKRL